MSYNSDMGNEQIKRNKRKVNFFILYRGLSLDYLFLYAIDSIYFSQVMGMSFSQITLLTTIFSLVYMVIQIPIVRLIRKMGTSNASKVGTFIMAASNIFLFFYPWMVYVSYGLGAVGYALKTLSEPKILKDNLKMYGLSDNYSKYSAYIKSIYSFLASGACFAAGFLFDAWNYAPIVIATAIMFVCAIMSLFIKNEKEIYKKQNNLPAHNVPIEKHEVFKLFKYHTTWLLLFFSAAFTILCANGMDINKMTFQEVGFSAITITITIGVIRIFRAASSLGFSFIYRKMKYSAIYIVLAMVGVGLVAIGLGGMLLSGTAALVVMAIGSILLYSSRDPFNIVREDFVMNSKGLTKRQTLFSITNIGCYLGRFLMSLAISGILISQSTFVMNLILAAAFVPIALTMSLLLGRKRKLNRY